MIGHEADMRRPHIFFHASAHQGLSWAMSVANVAGRDANLNERFGDWVIKRNKRGLRMNELNL